MEDNKITIITPDGKEQTIELTEEQKAKFEEMRQATIKKHEEAHKRAMVRKIFSAISCVMILSGLVLMIYGYEILPVILSGVGLILNIIFELPTFSSITLRVIALLVMLCSQRIK